MAWYACLHCILCYKQIVFGNAYSISLSNLIYDYSVFYQSTYAQIEYWTLDFARENCGVNLFLSVFFLLI